MQATQDISIRYIKPEDYLEVLKLAKEPVKAVLPDKPFEEEKIEALFNTALINELFAGIVLVIDAEIKGFILGHVTEHYFHSTKLAYCMAIFVKEESRKYGLEMLKAFESWGKYMKADTLCISTFHNLSPEYLNKVYKKLGYTEKEIVHWKEI